MSPRGQCQIHSLHSLFKHWGRQGTLRHCTIIIAVHDHLTTDEAGHVATVTLTLLERVELDVSFGHVIGPTNKPAWAERLMASAALTGRTMRELVIPVVSWDLLECFLQ